MVSGFSLHAGYKDVLASVFDGSRVFFKSTEGAQDACDFVSSLLRLDRTYLFLDHLACVLFVVCLSSFGVMLRFCMSRRSDSSWSL